MDICTFITDVDFVALNNVTYWSHHFQKQFVQTKLFEFAVTSKKKRNPYGALSQSVIVKNDSLKQCARKTLST